MDSLQFMKVQRNGPIRFTDPVNHVPTIYRSCSFSIKLPLCFQLNTDSSTNVIMSILSQRHKMLAPITTHPKKKTAPALRTSLRPTPLPTSHFIYDVTTNALLQDITWRSQTAVQ